MKKSVANNIEMTIAYIIIFFILREWLVPIMELTDTGLLQYFLVFIGLALVLSLVNVNAVLSGLVKMGYITWFIVYAYADNPVLSLDTPIFLMEQLKENLSVIFTGQFGLVTDSFRTILFFMLIWMLVYLIHHWITVHSNIFYFFVITIFFIATLDTFSEYDGSVAIIKVVVLGLVMTGALFVRRLWLQTDMPTNLFTKWKIIMPMLLVVAFSGVIALFLPKIGPTWADPVPFIKSATGQDEGAGQQKKVGYGEDDSRLGGPFVEDDGLVFNAYAEDRNYWRIETKDTYTSLGWIQSTDDKDFVSYRNGEKIEGSLLAGNDVNNRKKAKIEMVNVLPVVMQTYGLESIVADKDVSFLRNERDEKIRASSSGEVVSLYNYTIEYNKPVYSLEQLHASTFEMYEGLDISFERYLQLPGNLPQRVGDLALDVTKESASVYEKVKAVENYFDRSGFRYDKTAVAVPEINQDYVDQFLFDTKIGYCDNFSTSMVVMLRSLGIPARWVKGFSSGSAGAKEDGYRKYEVTNNNAHSWVEAYIPGSGWMEFEPTIGFLNDINIDNDIEKNEEQVLEKPKKPETKPTPKKEEKKEQRDTESSIIAKAWKWLKDHPIVWWSVGIFIVALVLMLFMSRRKWVPKMHVRSYRKKEANWSNFEASYSVLMTQLLHLGLRREEGETLRAFANRVDTMLETDDMKKLTDVYEQYIYGEQPININFDEMKESWENLINRTIG
ncbi:MAG: transglutaminaseTgpA domain-containing protein [Lysinibacillus sp.]